MLNAGMKSKQLQQFQSEVMREVDIIANRLDNLKRRINTSVYTAENCRGFLLDTSDSYNILLRIDKIKLRNMLEYDRMAWDEMSFLNDRKAKEQLQHIRKLTL